ncbi:hypothetical protein [Marinitenerispora sediminis]|uniref:Uncharacterized protein n=1 Tax=Marinitenerispora sediminis TaxID=1931232 RepID=A0A368T7U2_9ACTN|nr:hypothetical protein [Marinitenerispora sediminis]RCV51261.1 hypothetical protein DEF28_15990 [Marinitenerispora sediminis]RCV58064.1 hypothetical protein DEF24_14105 [Marinitenerispora sediminis]
MGSSQVAGVCGIRRGRLTHTGFRVYLRSNFRDTKDKDTKLDVAFAQAHNWFINWQGVQQW